MITIIKIINSKLKLINNTRILILIVIWLKSCEYCFNLNWYMLDLIFGLNISIKYELGMISNIYFNK